MASDARSLERMVGTTIGGAFFLDVVPVVVVPVVVVPVVVVPVLVVVGAVVVVVDATVVVAAVVVPAANAAAPPKASAIRAQRSAAGRRLHIWGDDMFAKRCLCTVSFGVPARLSASRPYWG
jgi:hypothetical protein